jgi:hypothetical protein
MDSGKTGKHRSRMPRVSASTLAVLGLVVASLVLFGLARLLNSNGRDVWNGAILNLFAEGLGVAVGIVVLGKLAQAKFFSVAPDLVRFVAQLRRDGTISPKAARRSVVCIAALLGEGKLEQLRRAAPVAGDKAPCHVCSLRARTDGSSGQIVCHYCKLPNALWQSLIDDVDEDTDDSLIKPAGGR